jgi:hypothetical protein
MNMTADSTEFAGTAVASDDLDLVHAIQSGDVSAFDQLVGLTGLMFREGWYVTQNRQAHPSGQIPVTRTSPCTCSRSSTGR